MRRSTWLLGVVVLTASISCQQDQGGPTAADPGPLALVLATPNSDDGILLLTITGGRVDSVSGSADQMVLSRPADGVTKIVVRGTISAGAIGRIFVADRRQVAGYQITVNQAAARKTYVFRPNASIGYTITLTRP